MAKGLGARSRMCVRPCCAAVMAAIVLVLGGCGKEEPDPGMALSEGIVLRQSQLEEHTFEIVEVDVSKASLRLFWKHPGGRNFAHFSSLEALLEESGHQMVFVTNAGIFGKDAAPLGLHIEDGKTLSPLNGATGSGNFFLEPNGVFYLDDEGPHVVETRAYAALNPSPEIAVQSGPLLVVDGAIHPAFQAQSPNMHVRSGVGIDSEGKVCFAISRKPVNFHSFASLFLDVLGCRNALYLDGAISALHVPGHFDRKPSTPFAGMIGAVQCEAERGASNSE